MGAKREAYPVCLNWVSSAVFVLRNINNKTKNKSFAKSDVILYYIIGLGSVFRKITGEMHTQSYKLRGKFYYLVSFGFRGRIGVPNAEPVGRSATRK